MLSTKRRQLLKLVLYICKQQELKLKTITIQITNKKAYKLLKELEDLHLIRMLKSKDTPGTQIFSDKFAGKLKLTDEQYENFQQHIAKSRNEWQKDF